MKQDMNVYISFDFEGIGGIALWSETTSNSRHCEHATRQLVTFCEGILEANPEASITISDSHAFGDNLIWTMLPEKVNIIRGWPRYYYMMEGIDESFTHLVLFGYHTAVGGGGLMDHTYSGSSIYEIKVNGLLMDEGLINAHFASEFEVPLTFIYGDDKTIEYISLLHPEVDYIISKRAISRFSGEMYSYKTLLSQLKEKGRTLGAKKGVLPSMKKPLDVEITFTDTTRAYIASIIPGISLFDYRKIRFTAEDFKEMYRYLMTVTHVCIAAKTIK